MRDDLIVVFGGSGFIGKYVVKTLARTGARVRIAMRRPHLGHDLRVLGDVGQIQLVQANLRYADSVERAMDGADAAVNCVGLLFEKGPQRFKDVQAAGAAAIARAAAKHGIKRLVHISAIGADAGSKSVYARTKAEAEAAVRAAVPTATILRPSIVFGAEDQFFNRFADMAKFAPALPLIGGGKTRFQPVYVQDVAEAVCAALSQPTAHGRTYELGGPKTYTFRELLDFITRTIDRPRPYAPLPFALAQPMGAIADAVFKLYPFAGPPLTGDQVELLKRDNVVGESGAPGIGTFADLGVAPLETIEAIVPSYLWRFRPHGQFQTKPA
ncbi:MAG: complex I NDUFA9 subunit family protein [Alphaproteobacteria bacterium]|nr:complex I NDUFA9 subunit family protein [Alphaproteobacteria bacterium]